MKWLIIFFWLCGGCIQLNAQLDRHYVIQLAYYENRESYDSISLNEVTLKKYGQLVKEEMPENKLRLFLLDRNGKFFTYESAKKTKQSIRQDTVSKSLCY